MHNVGCTIEGTTLIPRVDLGRSAIDAAPPSASGKTRLVASTSGAMSLAGAPNGKGISVSLNVMVKG